METLVSHSIPNRFLYSKIETQKRKILLLPCFHKLDSTMADKGKAKAGDGPSWWDQGIDPKYCFRYVRNLKN